MVVFEDSVTEQHMLNPKVGDRYTEMYSFWLHVVSVSPLIIEEYVSPCSIPEDCRRRRVFVTPEQFRKAYAYSKDKNSDMSHKYWIDYIGSGAYIEHIPKNIDGWADEIIDAENLMREENKDKDFALMPHREYTGKMCGLK